jgi:hypothetical protein
MEKVMKKTTHLFRNVELELYEQTSPKKIFRVTNKNNQQSLFLSPKNLF